MSFAFFLTINPNLHPCTPMPHPLQLDRYSGQLGEDHPLRGTKKETHY